MAPALSEAGRDTYHSQRGEGGAPGRVNGKLLMDGPGADHFLKDAQEMEQILGELEGADILRVIETMEGAGGGLAMDTMEADPMAALATFDRDFLSDVGAMPADPEGEGAGVRERIAEAQARLERRCQFLRRRLRMQQARAMGKHAAEEAHALFRHALGAGGAGLTRSAARVLVQRLEVGAGRRAPAQPGPPWAAPPGLAEAAGALRTQLRLVGAQLDSDATLSSSGAESADETVTYNNPFQQSMPLRKRALWKWSQERAWIASRWGWLQAQVQELEHRIRQHAELLRQVRAAKGPPAPPAGYSGPLPGLDAGAARARPLARGAFRKRKLLQMHNLHTAADKAARPSDIRCICQWPLGGCAVCTGRAMPMHPLPPPSTLSRRERIALVDPGFHTVLSTVKDVSSSIHYSAMMKDPHWQQKSSRGSVKSIKSLSAKMQPSSVKVNTSIPKISQHKKRKYNRLKRGRGVGGAELGRGGRRSSLQDPDREDMPSGGSSPVPEPSEHHRYRIRERTRLNSSYDIDNIVIPHSIAANTKLEILQYKEILTPKWRMVEEELAPPNNGLVRKRSLVLTDDMESDTEDVSEAGVVERHDRCEAHERGKYLKKRKNSRRQNSRTTPTQTPPHTPMVVDETSMSSEAGNHVPVHSVVTSAPAAPPVPVSAAASPPTTTACSVLLVPLTESSNPPPPANPISNKRRITEDSVEMVPPYSPRMFPLLDDMYTKMLKAMPDNHPLSITECSARSHTSNLSAHNRASDSESSTAYKNCYPPLLELEPPSESEEESGSIPADEDPTDPEWNVMGHADKLHHR